MVRGAWPELWKFLECPQQHLWVPAWPDPFFLHGWENKGTTVLAGVGGWT